MISFKCIGVLLLYIANIKLDQFVTLRFTSPMPSYTCLTVLPFQVLVPTITSRFSDITCITCWKSNPSIRGRGGHCLLSATERDIKAFFSICEYANIIIVLIRCHQWPAIYIAYRPRVYEKWYIGNSWLAKMEMIWSLSCE